MSASRADEVSRTVTRTALGLSGLIVAVFIAWCMGLLAGWPALPLSDKRGTERVFAVPEGRALAAITNAFREVCYCQMILSVAVGQDWLAKGWHPTNGFLLE